MRLKEMSGQIRSDFKLLQTTTEEGKLIFCKSMKKKTKKKKT